MRPKTEKLDTEVRREQIAQAAFELIAERGFKGLKVASIARSIGLVPSAIYRHFRGKEQLIDLLLERIRWKLMGNLRLASAQRSDPVEVLHELLRLHVNLVWENEAIPIIIFSDHVYAGRAERRAKMYHIMRDYLAGIRAWAVRGQKEGRIRPELDGGTVALLFLGIIQPGAIFWHMSGGEFDLTKHAEKAWAVLERILTTG